jgi:plastocyanin
MPRPLRTVLTAALLIAATAACGSSTKKTTAPPTSTTTATPATTPTSTPPTSAAPQNQSGTAAITIQNFAFSPTPLNVKVGTKVTVTNKDGFDHTWTSDNGTWDSGHISSNQSYTFTFSQPGTYTYHCAIHTYMKATLNVT